MRESADHGPGGRDPKRRMLEDALVELSTQHRAALRMAIVEKLRCQEIGRRLGMSNADAIRLLGESMGFLNGRIRPSPGETSRQGH